LVSALPLTEAVTASFYAWETRGRGWMLADYPVSLEPPYRPFFLLPQLAPERFFRLDDGKRPTVPSLLIEGVKRLLSKSPVPEPVDPYEEDAAFPALEADELCTLQVLVPSDFAIGAGIMRQFFAALSAALHPVAYELIGTRGQIVIQVTVAECDVGRVSAAIEGFMPGVAAIETPDALADRWDAGAVQRVIDFGLADEFFLPLPGEKAFPVDPYIALVPALAAPRSSELLAFQILVEPVRNPWRTAIQDAIDDGSPEGRVADAPWMLKAASAKIETPLFAVVMRAVAQAENESRAYALLRDIGAFVRQYHRPGGNTLVPLSNDGYPDEMHAASVRFRESFRTGMLLSADELAGILHFPDESVRHPALVRGELRTKELPYVARGHDLVLGENHHRGRATTATLDAESRFAHMWLIGGSGTGKSNLIAHLAHQDIEAGHGVLVLDPHGDLIDDIARRVPEEHRARTILFDPSDTAYPIGFNILDARSDIERNLLASDLVAIFRRFTTSWGDTMSTVLGEAVLAVLAHPEGGTLGTLKRLIVDDAFRRTYLVRVADPDIRRFWEKDYPIIGARSAGPLIARLDTFLRSRVVRGIVSQRKGRLDLAEVMERGKVLLVRLGKGLIGEENAYLLGSLLLAKCNQLALARQAIPIAARRPFFCYADEFQSFVTPSIESLATEGRKYRFGLTVAHQMLAQLSDVPRIEGALLSSCHTRIVFRVGDGDAKKLAEGFSFFEARDLAGLPRGEAIARVGGAAHDFNLRIAPPSPVDEEAAECLCAALVEQSRARYAVPYSDLACEEPAVPVEVTAARPDDAAPRVTPPEEVWEESREPSRPVSGSPSPRKTMPKASTPGRGGEQHKYLQHLIKRLAEERGFRASIEDVAGDGRADVVLRRDDAVIGCEISITTDTAHEFENLKKCIAAGFARILFVSPEKKQREKMSALINKELSGAPVAVIRPEDLVAALDALGPAQSITASVTRGYKVKVKRQQVSPEDELARRKAVASVIARAIKKT
jgi:hypothetical protein